MRWRLLRRDLLFLIETLMPGQADPEGAAERVGADEELIAAMLDDERLFQRLMADEEILVRISPWLFFSVLLRQARNDLQGATFTPERRSRQKVLIFDTERVLELLEQEPLRDYLATTLASFTRVGSVSVPVQLREGVWRWYRASDMDVESLIRYCQALDPELRFDAYRRVADVCLFMSGMFPDHIDAQYRYPHSGKPRPRARGRLVRSLEDYEAHGRAFYRLAAQHEQAHMEGLTQVLATLSENFILAEKPLRFLADHYLGFARQRLFNV